MVKFLTSIFLTLTLLTTPVLAGSCPGGASNYEEGFSTFEEGATIQGGSFLAEQNFDDGSLISIWDFRDNPDVDPVTPFFVLIFDPSHCYDSSLWFSQQQVQDAFGIILANT